MASKIGMFRLLTAREIECRVAQSTVKGLSLLLYKDARCDMNILDETVGPFGWKRSHSRENANCTVSIFCAERGEWISKEDTGTESNTEAAKGLASDSFKRACFNWGIGRELYTAPFIWIQAGKYETVNRNGKEVPKDSFEVADIGYDDNREINRLRIINSRSKQTVFELVSKRQAAAPEVKKAAAPEVKKTAAQAIMCKSCGAIITDIIGKNGEIIPAEKVLDISTRRYGVAYCADCMKETSRLDNA